MNDSNAKVRKTIVKGLAIISKLGDARVLHVLHVRLGDCSRLVKNAAADALLNEQCGGQLSSLSLPQQK